MDIIQFLNKDKMLHVKNVQQIIFKLLVIIKLMLLDANKDIVQKMEFVKLVQLIQYHAKMDL